MAAIKVGTSDISAVYVGSASVSKIYVGTTQVWPAQSASFSIDPTSLTGRTNSSGSATITFSQGVSNYVFISSPAWVTVTEIVSSNLTTGLTVSYTANTGSQRSGNIQFSAGGSTFSVAISQSATSSVSVTGVSLNKASTTITAGSTEQLTATVTPSNATDKSVVWSSSNTSVATVSSSGLVTAVSTGSATITVRTNDGNYTATCTAAVTSASFSVQPTQLEFEHNESTYVSYKEVAITTAQSWTASITSGFTIHNNVTSGTGNKTLYIYPSNVNNNTTPKTGTLTITPNVGTAVSVSLTQKAAATNYRFSISASPSGCTIVINDVQRSYYDCPAGTSINWSVSKSGYTQRTGQYTMDSSNHMEYVTLSSSTVAVTGVSVSPTTLTVNAGSTNTLTATVTPSNASDKSVSWSSSNTSVATVNSSGVVSGVSAGSATITVTTTDGHYTATSAVTVQAAVSITSSLSNLSAIGNTYGIEVSDVSSIGWTLSSNKSWCQVSPSSGTGSATITVTIGNNTSTSSSRTAIITCTPTTGTVKTCTVTQSAATAVSVSPSSITFNASGSTETITITGTFSEWWIGENDCPSWCTPSGMSGNTSTISVTTSGNTSGSTRTGSIVVNVDGTDYSISVSQEPVSTVIPVTGVSVSPSTLSLVAGKTSTLTATVSPSNATDKSVTWSSSNTSVASVNEYGVVSAVGAGSVTITATSNYDSTKTGSCSLTVAAATLTVSPTSMSFTSRQGTSANGKDLTITANGDWNMSLSGSGFNTDKGTSYSSTGNGTISVYPSTLNNSSSSRSATITVTAYGPISKTVSVTQSGVETLDVTYNGSTATSLTFAATDDTQPEGKTLYITTANQGWTATVSSGFSLTTNSGVAGPSALGVYPSSANTGSTNKTGTLTIQGTVSGSATINLTQNYNTTALQLITVKCGTGTGDTDEVGMNDSCSFYEVYTPSGTTATGVTWSIVSMTTPGSCTGQMIDFGGESYFTVTINGSASIGDTITVRATSTAVSGKSGEKTVTVTYDAMDIGDLPESVEIDYSDFAYNAGSYVYMGSSYQMKATVYPLTASQDVTWSLKKTNGSTWTDTSKVSITPSGLLTISANSWTQVKVVATCVADDSITDSINMLLNHG